MIICYIYFYNISVDNGFLKQKVDVSGKSSYLEVGASGQEANLARYKTDNDCNNANTTWQKHLENIHRHLHVHRQINK